MFKKFLASAGAVIVMASSLVATDARPAEAQPITDGVYGEAYLQYGEEIDGKPTGLWANLTGAVDKGYKAESAKDNPHGEYREVGLASFNGLSPAEASRLFATYTIAEKDIEGDKLGASYSAPDAKDGVTGSLNKKVNNDGSNDVTVKQAAQNKRASALGAIFEWYSSDSNRVNAVWDRELNNQIVEETRAASNFFGEEFEVIVDAPPGTPGVVGGDNEVGTKGGPNLTNKLIVTSKATGERAPHAVVALSLRTAPYTKMIAKADANGVLDITSWIDNVRRATPERSVPYAFQVIDFSPASQDVCPLKVYEPVDPNSTASKVLYNDCYPYLSTKSSYQQKWVDTPKGAADGPNGPAVILPLTLEQSRCGYTTIKPTGVPSYSWMTVNINENVYGVYAILNDGWMWKDPAMGSFYQEVDLGARPDDCAITWSDEVKSPETKFEAPLGCVESKVIFDENGNFLSDDRNLRYDLPQIEGVTYEFYDSTGYRMSNDRYEFNDSKEFFAIQRNQTAFDYETDEWIVETKYTVKAVALPGYSLPVDADLSWVVDTDDAAHYLCAQVDEMNVPRFASKTQTCGVAPEVIIPNPSYAYGMDGSGASFARMAEENAEATPPRTDLDYLKDLDYAYGYTNPQASYEPGLTSPKLPIWNQNASMFDHRFVVSPEGATTGLVKIYLYPGLDMKPAKGQQTVWEFDLTPEPCDVDLTPVTPQAPDFFAGPPCDAYGGQTGTPELEAYSPHLNFNPNKFGVEYFITTGSEAEYKVNDSSIYESLPWSTTVTVRAQALPGFTIPSTEQSSWTFQTAEGLACTSIVSPPRIKPADTCGVKESIIADPPVNGSYSWEATPPEVLTTGYVGKVTLKAVLNPGFLWADPDAKTTWEFDLAPVDPCDEEVTTYAPVVVPAETCGVGATYYIPPAVGVVYTADRPGAREGVVTITATPASGYFFSPDTVTSWALDLGSITPCPLAITPVEPVFTSSTTCGVGDSFVLPNVEGITYTVDKPNATVGEVTIKATANPGYQIASGATSSWTFVLKPITPCPTEVTPVTPTIIPASACGSGASIDLPVTTGVTYTADRPYAREGVVIITASTEIGYIFAENAVTTWTLDLGTIEPCLIEVMPFTPTITAASVCGEGASIALQSTEGVIYTLDRPDANEGLVTVTASAALGYILKAGVTTTWTLDLGVITPCPTLVTAITPTVTPATVCGEGATLSIPTVEGVLYSTDKPDAKEGQVTVTASALPGFTFAPNAVTSWTLDLGVITPCDEEVTTVSPRIVTAPTCGVGAKLELPVTTGVTYTADRPGAREGLVTVTAKANSGYVLAPNAITSWTFDLGQIQPCPIEVTPVKPTVKPSSVCGVGSSIVLDLTEGVTYIADRPEATEGLVKISALADEGYVLAPGAVTSWTLDLGEIKACDTVVAPLIPTITPAATCGVTGTVQTPVMEGVYYKVEYITLNPGEPASFVNIEAIAQPGFTIDPNSIATWTLYLGNITPCPIEITPATPTVTPAATCGEGSVINLPTMTGVKYSLTPADAKEGVVTITATATSGYVFPSNVITSWTVTLPAIVPCLIEVTPAAPTVKAPAACGEGMTFDIPVVSGVIYAVDRPDAKEGIVTITATAASGYTFSPNAQTSWVLDLGVIAPCPTEVTSETPTVQPAQTCGVGAKLVLPATLGVSYTVDRPNAVEGIVKVTAEAAAGYVLADNSITSWELDLGAVNPCPIEVKPIAPTITEASVCGEGALIALPATTGVTYTSNRPDAREGLVTIAATAQAGYSIPAGEQTSWILDLGLITPCPSAVEAIPQAPTVKTSETCGEGDSLVINDTLGVSYQYDESIREGLVTVTAIAQAGYFIPATAETVWTFNLPPVKPCVKFTELQAPSVIDPIGCGMPKTIRLPEIAGVTYELDRKDAQSGLVKVKAVFAEGVTVAPDIQTEWVLDLGEITPCESTSKAPILPWTGVDFPWVLIGVAGGLMAAGIALIITRRRK